MLSQKLLVFKITYSYTRGLAIIDVFCAKQGYRLSLLCNSMKSVIGHLQLKELHLQCAIRSDVEQNRPIPLFTALSVALGAILFASCLHGIEC